MLGLLLVTFAQAPAGLQIRTPPAPVLQSAPSVNPSQRFQSTDVGPNADIEALAFIVMMESAKSAQQDLKSIMDGVKALNASKKEAREVLSEMKREQRRLRADSSLKRDQLDWASSLAQLCAPGTSRSDCLLRQLRLRTAALKARPTPRL